MRRNAASGATSLHRRSGEGAHRARVRPGRGAFAVGGAQPLRAVDPAAGAPLVVPVGHGQELGAIGDALRTILRKVDVALEKPAFNLFLHTMPRDPRKRLLSLASRREAVLTQQAGFEWASGCYINPRHRRRPRASSGRRRSFREDPSCRFGSGAIRQDRRAGRRHRRAAACARGRGHDVLVILPAMRRSTPSSSGCAIRAAGWKCSFRISTPGRTSTCTLRPSGCATSSWQTLVRPPGPLRRERQGLPRQSQALRAPLRRLAGGRPPVELHPNAIHATIGRARWCP